MYHDLLDLMTVPACKIIILLHFLILAFPIVELLMQFRHILYHIPFFFFQRLVLKNRSQGKPSSD